MGFRHFLSCNLALLSIVSTASAGLGRDIFANAAKPSSSVEAPSAAPAPFVSPVARLRILVPGSTKEGPGFCSSFVLKPLENQSKRILVTAAHCVPGWPAAKIEGVKFTLDDGFKGIQNRIESPGRSLDLKPDPLTPQSPRDVAIVSVDASEMTNSRVLPLAKGLPKPGEKLMMVGYPHGNGPFGFECKYLGYNPVPSTPNGSSMTIAPSMHCATADGTQTIQGASGGAVINDKGEAVGVVISQNSFPEVAMGLDGKPVPIRHFNGVISFTGLTSEVANSKGEIHVKPYANGVREEVILDHLKNELYKVKFMLQDGLLDGTVQTFGLNGEPRGQVVYSKGMQIQAQTAMQN